METIVRMLNELHSDIDFNNAEGLIDDGVLDSLDIVSLVAQIDAELGITVPAEEIVPENFNSAQALMDLITRIDEE